MFARLPCYTSMIFQVADPPHPSVQPRTSGAQRSDGHVSRRSHTPGDLIVSPDDRLQAFRRCGLRRVVDPLDEAPERFLDRPHLIRNMLVLCNSTTNRDAE